MEPPQQIVAFEPIFRMPGLVQDFPLPPAIPQESCALVLNGTNAVHPTHFLVEALCCDRGMRLHLLWQSSCIFWFILNPLRFLPGQIAQLDQDVVQVLLCVSVAPVGTFLVFVDVYLVCSIESSDLLFPQRGLLPV
jgi:hypothetical protein